jgi:hypothetical protein
MRETEHTFAKLPDDEAERGVLEALNRGRVALGLEPRSEALWRWRTRANPDGACLGVARDEAGRVRAAIVGVRRAARLAEERVAFLEITDLFNDFEAGRGLARARAYVELGEGFSRAFGGAAPEKHPLMWGIPTRRAHRIGLARHGFEILRTQSRLSSEVRRFAPGGASDVELEDVERFPADAGELFERFARGRGALLERDAARLDWRYALHPERRYRIALARRAGALVGYAVCRLGAWGGESGALLVDWCVPPEERGVGSALLAWAGFLARRGGAARLVTSVPDKSPEWALFQDRGLRVSATDEVLAFRSFQKPYVMSWLFAHGFLLLGDGERG